MTLPSRTASIMVRTTSAMARTLASSAGLTCVGWGEGWVSESMGPSGGHVGCDTAVMSRQMGHSGGGGAGGSGRGGSGR